MLGHAFLHQTLSFLGATRKLVTNFAHVRSNETVTEKATAVGFAFTRMAGTAAAGPPKDGPGASYRAGTTLSHMLVTVPDIVLYYRFHIPMLVGATHNCCGAGTCTTPPQRRGPRGRRPVAAHRLPSVQPVTYPTTLARAVQCSAVQSTTMQMIVPAGKALLSSDLHESLQLQPAHGERHHQHTLANTNGNRLRVKQASSLCTACERANATKGKCQLPQAQCA